MAVSTVLSLAENFSFQRMSPHSTRTSVPTFTAIETVTHCMMLVTDRGG